MYEYRPDIHESAPRLLELPRAHAWHALLLELRQAIATPSGGRLFRAFRNAAQALDRNERPGTEISTAQLEAASRQFRQCDRAGARTLTQAQLGIERRLSHAPRSRGPRRISTGHRRCAQRRRTQATGAPGIARRSL